MCIQDTKHKTIQPAAWHGTSFLIKVQKKETHKTAAQVACRLFCAEHTFICSEQKKETHRPAGNPRHNALAAQAPCLPKALQVGSSFQAVQAAIAVQALEENSSPDFERTTEGPVCAPGPQYASGSQVCEGSPQ